MLIWSVASICWSNDPGTFSFIYFIELNTKTIIYSISEPYVTEDELKLMLRGAELSGAIEEEEQVMNIGLILFLIISLYICFQNIQPFLSLSENKIL